MSLQKRQLVLSRLAALLAVAAVSCSGAPDSPVVRSEAESEPAGHTPTPATHQGNAGEAVVINDDIWDLAASAIRHVPPDSFPNVPSSIKSVFEAHRCAIPQAFDAPQLRNVISGEFAVAGQSDWAALCTRGDSAAVFIHWGGPVTCPSPIASSANRDYLQTTAPDWIEYSRLISVASMEFILSRAREYDGPTPPSTDHSGINDAFLEKGSVVHYCHEGRWFRLAGVD
jgi:hypothetical protein